MRLARIAVAWCGGILAFFGALYFVATERMLGYAEIVNPAPTALTDLRVMYVALQVAPGLFCLASLRKKEWLEPALALATLTFALIPAVRLLGMLREGTFNTYHLTAIAIEIATCAFAAIAWRGLRLRRTE
jgi:hypothetical protein